MEPLLGIAADFASNAFLLPGGGHSVSDLAVLANDPTSYDVDALHLALAPSLRYSDSGGGYTSLASNYFHLSGNATVSADLDIVSLTAAVGRDSSLYQNEFASNGVGVRLDSTSSGLDWQHTLSPRALVTLDAGWSRASYNESAKSSGLVDYRYVSVASSGSYALTERNKLNLQLSVGDYAALDSITKSRNYSLQLGFDRQLSEIWTLSTSAGYAKSDNSIKVYEGPFLLGGIVYGPFYVGTVKSEQKGPVYNASLTRRGETITFGASASRAFKPSGFEYLSRQDVAELNLTDIYSDRWTFAAKVDYQNTSAPQSNGTVSSVHYFSGQMSADWHWTPAWVVSLQAKWIQVKYNLPPDSAQSTGLSLQISRQFLRIEL
jgi:hypothetical protein